MDLDKIADGSVLVASEEQVSCELEGAEVILNLADGKYYEMDAVAARIWKLLQTPQRFGDVRDVILDEYDVDRETCERDLQDLLRDLAQHDLVKYADGTTSEIR